MFANTPKPPYYAVIFTSLRTPYEVGYADAAVRMMELATEQAGFLGVESVRGQNGLGITVSYWESEAAIAAWRNHAEHTLIREQGRADWYTAYETRVAKVERAYGFRVPQLQFIPAQEADQDYVYAQTQLNLKLPPSWDRATLAREWPQFQNHLLYHAGQRVGLLRWRERDGALHVSDVQIEAAHRRKGLGKQALRQFENMARAQGYARVSLRVFHDNIDARRLYLREGYVETEHNDSNAILTKQL